MVILRALGLLAGLAAIGLWAAFFDVQSAYAWFLSDGLFPSLAAALMFLSFIGGCVLLATLLIKNNFTVLLVIGGASLAIGLAITLLSFIPHSNIPILDTAVVALCASGGVWAVCRAVRPERFRFGPLG